MVSPFAEGKICSDSYLSRFQDGRQRLHKAKAPERHVSPSCVNLNLCHQPAPLGGILTLFQSCPASHRPFVHKPFSLHEILFLAPGPFVLKHYVCILQGRN